MGAQGSRELPDPSISSQQVGYRVLGVQSHSPAERGGLVSFFDFIVAANGTPLRVMDATFINIIQEFEDKELALTVYNFKAKTHREVVLVPSKNWPGEGMLGVTIKFDTYFDADESLCHVLEVEENSPAELAGLQPETDYLLGTAEIAFKDADVLLDYLKANLDHPVEIYVYNSVTDEVRVVILMPTHEWDGQGILGASIAHGILHVLPSACCNTIGKSSITLHTNDDLEAMEAAEVHGNQHFAHESNDHNNGHDQHLNVHSDHNSSESQNNNNINITDNYDSQNDNESGQGRPVDGGQQVVDDENCV